MVPTLILGHGSWRLAVMVDDIPEELPLVVKPLGRQFQHVSHILGGAIRADGTVVPVLDPRALLERARTARRSPGGGRSDDGRGTSGAADSDPGPLRELEAQPWASVPPTILVVDDSITTRALERNLLEAAGYRVLVAAEGQEALEVMQAEPGVDLVVTDLEMPRMDGFELCRRLRSRSPDLPIVVVTSRGEAHEQQRGMEAGADAVIVKGNFHQDHFLATVQRFLG